MFLHVIQRNRHGGDIGLRDQGLIESALARPLASFEGHALYTTPFLRAGVLWHGLIKNHGFVDANKRTATLATEHWLDREGYWLRATDEEVIAVAVGIADGGRTVEEVAAWLEAHAEKRPT